jgi:transcriptional regulator with XRE-family HTH domain
MKKLTLAAARVSVGLTQEEMAKRMGVSRTLINMLENGKADIKPIYLIAYCQITGFTESDFLLPNEFTNSGAQEV